MHQYSYTYVIFKYFHIIFLVFLFNILGCVDWSPRIWFTKEEIIFTKRKMSKDLSGLSGMRILLLERVKVLKLETKVKIDEGYAWS